MNHADRERLSELIASLEARKHKMDPSLHFYLREARKIVDGHPAVDFLLPDLDQQMTKFHPEGAGFLNRRARDVWDGEPTPAARRWHTRLVATVVAVTAICVVLTVVLSTPDPGPSHQPGGVRPAKPAPRVSPPGFWPTPNPTNAPTTQKGTS